MTDSIIQQVSKEPCVYTQFACIGTGFSGIGLGATLKRWYDIGDIQFFERHSSLGGTWLANRYPGCACDVPTALYSYSFESNPDWSRVLPPATELWEYLNRVAGKYDLHRHMTFGVEVRRAEWIETQSRWRLTVVRLDDGTEFHHECQFLFGATGQIVRPRELDVPGVDTFKGPVFHSSQWRQDVDLTDKRVVVFGNGCTGAQVVTAIVGKTKHLTHIARAKHWFLPGIDAYINSYTRAALRIPGVSAFSRFLVFIFAEDQLRAFYQTWDAKRYRRNMGKAAEKYMRKTAPAKYHDILIPDFEVGCKRRIFDPGYLKALHAENLELTNDSVQEIVPEGVKMADGRLIEADVIVACNGFQMQNFLSPIEVIGVGGETAEQHWAKMGGGPEAYNCTSMSGFPNFFAILGKRVLIPKKHGRHEHQLQGWLAESRAKTDSLISVTRTQHLDWPHISSHRLGELNQLRSEGHQTTSRWQGHDSRGIARGRAEICGPNARCVVKDCPGHRMRKLVCFQAGRWKRMERYCLSVDTRTLLVPVLVPRVEGLAIQGKQPHLTDPDLPHRR